MPDIPTEKQQVILKYVKEHPGVKKIVVAAETGISTSYISNTLVKYMPEVTKVRAPKGLTKIQKQILDLHKDHPELAQWEIADLLGCSRSQVSLAYRIGLTGPIPRVRRGHYNKAPKSETFTVRACLRCGKDHESAHAGDRICPTCKYAIQDEDTEEYSVALDSRVMA